MGSLWFSPDYCRCAQALAVKAQGRGKLPVAQIDHIAQPDAIAAGFGLAEGGFLSLGGDAIFQGQIADWPLVVGLLQLHTVAEGVIQRAGAQLALQLQLAAKAQLLERGEGALAAISGVAAQGIVAQQLALVGLVAGLVANRLQLRVSIMPRSLASS